MLCLFRFVCGFDYRPRPLFVCFSFIFSSAIVDHFHGQLKSTFDCPKCGHHSVSFDPYSILNVPIPQKRHRFLQVVFVPNGLNKRPIVMIPKLLKSGNIPHLKAKIQQMVGVLPENMVTFACDVTTTGVTECCKSS
jgi:hypothetical protein